jgi:ATP-binding cassette, subfamily B, bacterial
MRAPEFLDLTWPVERLDDCLQALLRGAKLCKTGSAPDLGGRLDSSIDAGRWIERAAKHYGCEAERLDLSYRDMAAELPCAYPAILGVGPSMYLAVVGAKGKKLCVITPDLTIATISVDDVCRAVREPQEGPRRKVVDEILAQAQIPKTRRARTADFLLREQMGAKRFDQCWLLRGATGAGVLHWLQQSNALRSGAALIFAHTAQYLVWLVSWALLGTLSFRGQMDSGWLVGWALLLATLVPCRVLATWLQGVIAIGVGGLLKRRLLAGALRLQPEEIRHRGIGSFLGQALEAEAVESLALGGGIAGLLATVDLIVSGFVLGRLSILLAAWFALAIFLGWRFLVTYRRWTTTRMGLTQDLVESMVGHRTRLAQQPRNQWHDREDERLTGYFGKSLSIDRTGTWLIAGIPRGWLVAGLAFLVPSVVSGTTVSSQMAVMLGGILLAYTALDRFVGSFSEIAAAYVAWKNVAPLFHAASRPEILGTSVRRRSELEQPAGDEKVIEMDRLTFRHRQAGNRILQGCSLVIDRGDRVLLEGPSGGGKTTLASLLSGARRPESGLVLAGGLDIHTLGESGWRERVVSAPQFHENHILTETLAFNLLFGRCWPPGASDMEEADSVCRSLGLGQLLDRMPAGLLQMIGEGGWQLSHGERSRVYIARAILQNPEFMILDESFGALDPENLHLALEFTLEKANTLMVIAHP